MNRIWPRALSFGTALAWPSGLLSGREQEDLSSLRSQEARLREVEGLPTLFEIGMKSHHAFQKHRL